MLKKTYNARQLFDAQRMMTQAQQILTTAQQELADEQQQLADEERELIIRKADLKLHINMSEAISKGISSFETELPSDVTGEVQKRNPDLILTPSNDSDKLTVTILAE